MTVDWSNEPYVRLYTRETDDDLMLSWQARAVWHEMLKRFDRSGLLETRRGTVGLAAKLRMPVDVVEPAVVELLEDGRIDRVPSGFFAKNFTPAQEASKSDRLRQRESRLQRRDALVRDSGRSGVTDRHETIQSVTNRDRTSRGVTGGHARSHGVTLTSADPDPSLTSALLPVVTGSLNPGEEDAAGDQCEPGDGARALAEVQALARRFETKGGAR